MSQWVRTFVILFILTGLSAGCTGRSTDPTRTDQTRPISRQADGAAAGDSSRLRPAGNRNVGKWAVVIGISEYQYNTAWNARKGIPDLKYAHQDARAFADFLKSPMGGGFADNRILLLTNRDASVKEVRKAIGDFLAQSLEDDVVILFFAGHGSPDPKNPQNLYLLCYDTEPDNFYGTALPMWEIDMALERSIRSKRVFILADACHSAGVGGTRAIMVANRFNTYMNALAQSREGVTKITASRANELSQEKEFSEGGHGVFTHYLLEGLKGSADDNRDGFVTMEEAYRYLFDRVRSETRHSQNPWASAYVNNDIPIGIVDPKIQQTVQSGAIDRPEKTQIVSSLPADSRALLKLAVIKLNKNRLEDALALADQVILRNDHSKPTALSLKIDIFLKQNRLNDAENIEDTLVAFYPGHSDTYRGIRSVYDYYIRRYTRTTDPAEQIRVLESYLNGHPNSPLNPDMQKKLQTIKDSIRARLEKDFEAYLTQAETYMLDRAFSSAEKELNKAEKVVHRAKSEYGLSLDGNRVVQFREEAERLEKQYFWENAYQQAKAEAEKNPISVKIDTWIRFLKDHEVIPDTDKARRIRQAIRQKLRLHIQKHYDRLLSEMRRALKNRHLPLALDQLDLADSLDRDARDIGITVNRRNINTVRSRLHKHASGHREYRVWYRSEKSAQAIELREPRDYEKRMNIYNRFIKIHKRNPFRRIATRRISDLNRELKHFKDKRFHESVEQAEIHLNQGEHDTAIQFLKMAEQYANPDQLQDLKTLARTHGVTTR